MSTSSAWTPERRAKQAEMIRRNRPWAKSTGPTTVEGKAVSSRNAYRGGHRVRHRAQMRHFREMGRAGREMMLLMRAAFAGGNLSGRCIDPAYDRSEAFVAAQARYGCASAAYWQVTRADDPDFRLPVEDDGYLPALAAMVLAAMDAEDDDPVEPQ